MALFDHFAPRINAYLRRLGTDPAIAEDLTQDVMVVLWRKAELFDPAKSSLGTWLFRIARNRRIDLARQSRRDDLDENEPMLLPAEPVEAGDDLDARRRDARIRETLALLPPEQMELVQLAFYRGLSHSQIAEATGQPLGTVKSRLRLAFGRLRRAIEADTAIDID
ncbi:ECF RNA polymerase sigma factor RpoE [Methylobrevis pamukkalensis]|uniref:ECF RNA polymerase sigma factor RpoE n=1 Tax=Methylobrevis pamukkalensis TaxID=1439726 RepID=A0A1E3H1X3_9HYPH|nr:ECF RNA polymerase sigma factor RpoE [Methylobrevis pamukkalensis]